MMNAWIQQEAYIVQTAHQDKCRCEVKALVDRGVYLDVLIKI